MIFKSGIIYIMFLMETVLMETTQKSGDVKILTFQDTMKIPLQLRVHFINSTFQKIIASYQLRSSPAKKSANSKGIHSK